MDKILKQAITVLLLLFASQLKAQSLQPTVVGALGGYSAPAGSASLSYNMGETFIATLQSDTVMLTQGFEQPYKVSPITGITTVCVGNTTVLSDSTRGGTWSSASTSTATIGSTGIVTGVTAGTTTISYTWSGITVTTIVTVTALPTSTGASNSGPICAGGTVTLYDHSINATAWSWTGSDGSASTAQNPVMSPTTTTTYSLTLTNTTTGCVQAAIYTTTVVVTPLANAGSIMGAGAICPTGTLDLSDAAGGGVWTSSNTTTGTIGSTSGILSGIGTGTATISYTVTNGCGSAYATTVITVNPLPNAGTINGLLSVCMSATNGLSDLVTGGMWSSGNTGVATVGSTGVVNAVTAGTASITYAVTNGCGTANAIEIVTVNSLPNAGAINGLLSVCMSATTRLSDLVTGGMWSSGNTGVATVGSTGVVNGVTAGTAAITYAVTNGCGTANAIEIVTVNSLPNAGTINGLLSVCMSATTGLSDLMTGGTWSSGNTGVATVGSTGVVNGVTAGTASITYAITNGCGTANAIEIVTVNPLPNAGTINGLLSVCMSATTGLSDLVTGGTWSSGNTGVANVGSTGVVNGVTAGTAAITYAVTNGCGTANAIEIVTVNPLPNAGTINGILSVCMSATTGLSDLVTGGTWSSGNMGVATVGSTGVVNGVTAGTAAITYAVTNGCGTANAIEIVTVNSLANAGTINGLLSVCMSATTGLSDLVTGGTWSSGNTGVATVGSTGVVNGVTAGTAVITYAVTNGCGTANAIEIVTVNSLPNAGTINGLLSVCMSATTGLSDLVTGGTWSSGNTGVATVGSTGVVNGVTAGTAAITYAATNGCGTANAIEIVTVNPLPNAGTINGLLSVCMSATTGLSDLVTGGTWSSGNMGVATVGSTGVVNGVTAGTASITYAVTNGCGIANAIEIVTVNSLPNAGTINGMLSVCMSATTGLSDLVTGGTWSSGNTGVATVGSTGVVNGVTAGTAAITYAVTNGCGIANAIEIVTVNSLPNAGTINGLLSVCMSATTGLSDLVTGGTWSSGNTGVATVGSTGVVNGVTAGTASITYAVTNGCGIANAIEIVTVNSLANAGTINGLLSVCMSATTGLSDLVTGGTWSSGNTGVATVGSTGVVNGVTAGTAAITYAVTNGCGTANAIEIVTVNSLPNAGTINGLLSVCMSATTGLSDLVTGGTWSSGNTGVATVGSTGVVNGVTAGTASITYAVTNGCGIANAIEIVTVNSLPNAGTINGLLSVCMSATTGLSDLVTGGTWSSGNTGVATVGSTGVVNGVTAGTAAITYAVTNGCGTANAIEIVTVNPLPDAGTINGLTSVCMGSEIGLSDVDTGGVWRSGNTVVATVGSTGIVLGIAGGTVNITYAVTNGCGTAYAIENVTVNTPPFQPDISGLEFVCVGATTALSDSVTGGTWSSGDIAVATVDSTGLLSGVAAGTALITYSLSNGCGTSNTVEIVTVNPLPDAGSIIGIDTVCMGDTLLLSDIITGGIWTSGNGNATILGNGLVLGVTAGLDTIAYSVVNSCGKASAEEYIQIVDCSDTSNATVGILMFPNPTQNFVTIQGTETIKSVEVYNSIGQTVFSGSFNNDNVVVSLAPFADDVYLFRINGNKVYKVVKE